MYKNSATFVILWDNGEWEFVENHEDGGHDYAWGDRLRYKKFKYSIVEVDSPLGWFDKTPEDELLDKIFGED